MEREIRKNGISNGDYHHISFHDEDDDRGDHSGFSRKRVDRAVGCRDKGETLSPSSSNSGFIEHRVSRLDTLAGIAIKYGVEVADIKKMNGLVTDLQMFALKTLQIPLPGRHPPSPCISNGSSTPGQSSSEPSLSRRVQCDLLDSFQSLRLTSPPRKVSPAMSSLQGYYGLKPRSQKDSFEGFEMAVYKKGLANHLEDGSFISPSPASNLPLNHDRKSRSLANDLLNGNGDLFGDLLSAEAGEGNCDKSNEKLMRRRQKSETDFTSRSQELLLDENGSSSGGFSAITGKGLALRSKASSRTNLAADTDTNGGFNHIRTDPLVADGFVVVRKSSSTPSLQDQEGITSSSIWPTSKWSLKPDLQALSAAAITRPIFDGLPKPLTGRKNKAALD